MMRVFHLTPGDVIRSSETFPDRPGLSYAEDF